MTTYLDRDAIGRDVLRARMIPLLPAGLVTHIDRVVATAESLARRHGLDVETTVLMAQAHDVLRATPAAELLAEAERRRLPVNEAERSAPILLHGPLGAIALSERGWVRDPIVLHAVRFHTAGHPDLTPEGWAMVIADKIEPSKRRRWPALEAVVEIAEYSLEIAALTYLDLLHAQGRRRGWVVDPAAETTRQALRERLGASARSAAT